MTDQTPPPPSAPDPSAAVPPPPAYVAPPAPAYGAPAPVGAGPVGKIRGTGVSILLAIVTLGIYQLVWWYKTADERKLYSGQGLGGGVSLLIAFFLAPVMIFLGAAEVGNLQAQYGQQKTVPGLTGLWILLPLIGSIVWFVKVNGAINAFWKSQGVAG